VRPGATLRVSLDVSAVPLEPAGAGRYVLELAGALARRRDVEPVLVSRRGDTGRWRQVAGEGFPDTTVLGRAPAGRPARLAWEQLGMRRVLAASGVAVHHGPHYTMPERTSLPVVVTIHDCTFFDHPEWHERSKVLFFRRAIRRAARRASHLVCVSRTTAGRLAASCELRAPVTVVPHGVDHTRFAPDADAGTPDAAVLGGIGLDPGRPLVVFIGTIEPRKDVAGLVRAFDRIAAGHPDAVLVLAGQRGWGVEGVEEAISGARHADRVVETGYVPDAAVPALLRAAAVVAYPAFEEGFGLPALEALACGAPLVTTSGTAMAEFAGPAATLVAPGDVDALAGALEGELAGRGGAAAAGRRRRGIEIAAGFTWEACADQHRAVYESALAAG
jgi:glycosyltransferase involved in cell wall biosynthesis